MKTLPVALTLALTLGGAALAADSPQAIWAAKCKKCHGEDGKAQTAVGKKEKMADLSSARWQQKHSDEEIRTAIAEGSKDNKKMKPYKDKLTPEEIDSLVKYVRALGGKVE